MQETVRKCLYYQHSIFVTVDCVSSLHQNLGHCRWAFPLDLRYLHDDLLRDERVRASRYGRRGCWQWRRPWLIGQNRRVLLIGMGGIALGMLWPHRPVLPAVVVVVPLPLPVSIATVGAKVVAVLGPAVPNTLMALTARHGSLAVLQNYPKLVPGQGEAIFEQSSALQEAKLAREALW